MARLLPTSIAENHFEVISVKYCPLIFSIPQRLILNEIQISFLGDPTRPIEFSTGVDLTAGKVHIKELEDLGIFDVIKWELHHQKVTIKLTDLGTSCLFTQSNNAHSDRHYAQRSEPRLHG